MTKRIFALLSVFLLALSFVGCSGSSYEKAKTLYAEQKHSEALELFKEISGYEDSANYIEKCEKIIAAEGFITENPIYFKGNEENCIHRASFLPDKEVKIECVNFTEDGVLEGETELGTYTMDEVGITLHNVADELTIAYAMLSGGNYFFTEGFCTLNKVQSSLLGNWSYTSEDGSIYEIEINEDEISYTVSNEGKTEGPFEASYKLGFGVFETDLENGDIFSYGIDGNNISLRVFSDDCKRVYSFT